jgi:phytoene dehydrogenase-like protein
LVDHAVRRPDGEHTRARGRQVTVAATFDILGRVGLPAPVGELASQRWDAVVVGGGHNGLAAAAYLAGAGRSVLVLERRDRVGGACTLEQPFADERFVMSPCAYLVGLLHPLVISELKLPRHGYRTWIADPTTWCPFQDGTSLADWKDKTRTTAEVAALSPGDVDGWQAYWDVFDRVRRALREGERDTWVGDSPVFDEVVGLLGDDGEAKEVVIGLPVADLIERHVADERLRTALHGGGLIGTFAGPRDPGTAWIRAMHHLGLLGGWSYVGGGMGRVSFALADAAGEAGAVIAAGVPVARIHPGQGVELEDGTRVAAAAVVSNADPKRTLAMIEGEVPAAFREKVGGWKDTSPVVKVNCALSRLPRFSAAPGSHVYRAQVTIATGMDASQAACEAAHRGEPAPRWAELYFQTPYDPSVAPPGKHTVSVFCQYVPYALAGGDWDTRREEIAGMVFAEIERFAPDFRDCIEDYEILGPPHVERRIGLTGGHIFQGECLPEQMWDRRFAARTGVEGLYLCGAATHPAGSVIGVNGRNAAMAVLADLRTLH